MAQRSHVPKFGDWESDNVPYTTYFDNARKEKTSGVKFNPNDPEENPEAFTRISGNPESDAALRVIKPLPAEKYYIEGHTEHKTHRINPSGSRKSGSSHMSITSESGSDKSNSEYSLMQAKQRRLKSDRKKSLVESSSSFSSGLPGASRVRTGNHPYDENRQRTASVPKFGAWDETDPNSGDGFTIIFNKVKEEKQIASATFPNVPPQPSHFLDGQKKKAKSPPQTKLCCCLFSRTSK